MRDQDTPAGVAPAVVTLPAEIELASAGLDSAGLDSAGPAYAALREAVASGAPAVVADPTGTTFCDYPGFHQLAMLHRQAATGDIQLRLAMPADGTVRCWLEFLARHRLVRVYPSLEAARTALRQAGGRRGGERQLLAPVGQISTGQPSEFVHVSDFS